MVCFSCTFLSRRALESPFHRLWDIGDAAAVLFTASFTDSLPYSLFKPVATLPLAIFFQLGTPFPEVQERGYASALVLTGIIFLISILSRVLSKKFSKRIVK